MKNQIKKALSKRNLIILLGMTIPSAVTLSALANGISIGKLPPLTDVQVGNPLTGNTFVLKNCFKLEGKKFCPRKSDEKFDSCLDFKGGSYIQTGENKETRTCLVHSILTIPSSDPTLYLLYFPEN
jgi:hypothetical protein